VLLDQPSNLSMSIVPLIKICFGEVRSFEAFKHLHVGMISAIKRKTLPEIALIRRIRARTVTRSFSHQITLVSQRIKKAEAKFNLACFKRKKNFSDY